MLLFPCSNADGVKKTSDKKNVSIELMYPLTGWMILSLTPQFEQGKPHWVADSDALIVKGLTHMLLSFLADQELSNIDEEKIKIAFGALGLETHLSAQRANGFSAMIRRVEEDIRKHEVSR